MKQKEVENKSDEILYKLFGIEPEKPVEEVSKVKTKTLFDHLKAVTQFQDPEYFKKLTDGDKKTWSTYMIIRYLSMNPDWVEIISDVEALTVGPQLEPERVYQILISIIPPSSIYLQYIKGKTEGKFEEELITIFARFYGISRKEATEYLHILYIIPNGTNEVARIVSMYGKDEKEVKKLMKVK